MPNVSELARYVGEMPDRNTDVLLLCMRAAVRWFANSGVPEPQEEDALYTLGVYMLAAHYYDHRSAVEDTGGQKPEDIPFGVMSIMHQLRL